MAKILPISKLPKGKKPVYTKKYIPTIVAPTITNEPAAPSIGQVAKRFKPGRGKKP